MTRACVTRLVSAGFHLLQLKVKGQHSYLLRVTFWIFHVNQNLTQPGFHCLHQELCRFQNHVTSSFHT